MPSGDPYIENILERVPKKVAKTLTPEQWEGFRTALKFIYSPTRHLLDLRFILPLYFTRIYCVLIFGKDTRERVEHVLFERRKRVAVAVGALVLAAAFVVLFGIVLLVLYILKSAAGVDLIPEWHFGDILE